MENQGIQGSSIFQEWAKRYAPGLYRVEGNTSFTGARKYLATAGQPLPSTPIAEPLSASPVLDTPTAFPMPEAPAADPAAAAPMEVAPPAEPNPSLTDRFSSGLSRVGEGLKDPAKMGLLAAGLSMMATPPRQVKYSNTEILGNAGLAGINYYEKALEAKRKDELMKETAEERTLAREDRRTAAEQRNEYYMGSLADRKAAQVTRDAIAADTALKNKRDNEKIGKNEYGIDPETPMWKAKDLKELQKQLNAPDKEIKPDAFTKWYEAKVAETGKKPSAKEMEDWHRSPGSGGGSDSGPGKVGAIGQVNRELGAMYLPHAKTAMEAKGPAGMEEYKGMVAMFQTTDQFGGTVNDARLRESLPAEQRKEYDFVKRKAQDYSRTMTPANAVAKAQEDWAVKNPPKKADTGQRYGEFKTVYEEIRTSALPMDQKKAKLKELTDYARSQGLIK